MKKLKLVHLPTRNQVRLWVKALRSGKYEQTRGTLQDKNGYCCLGVGCVVFVKKKNLVLGTEGLLIGSNPEDRQPVRPWLKKINRLVDDIMGISLMDMNDNDGYTFDEIADCLESLFIHNDPQDIDQ